MIVAASAAGLATLLAVIVVLGFVYLDQGQRR